MRIFVVLSLLLALVAVIFALQNAVPVTVRLFAVEFASSQATVLILTLIAGVLVGLFSCMPALMRHRWRNKRLTRRIHELELTLNERNQSNASRPVTGQSPLRVS